MKNYTESFDENLKTSLDHFRNYPQMLPYIGNKWGENKKILFLAESHFIPGVDINAIYPEIEFEKNWYTLNESYFNGHVYLKDYINTRRVIEQSDDVKNNNYSTSLIVYYNIKSELKTYLNGLKNEELVFPYFSIYNYFQRPSFIEGDTIQNTPEDDQVAFETLKVVANNINPEAIIFVSRKAFDSFNNIRRQTKDETFNNSRIERVPHAGSAWWNKVSDVYGGKTGREHFIDVIQSL